MPIQKYSIYQLIRLTRKGKRVFSWSQPFINLSWRGKIFYPEARASCITFLYPSFLKLFIRAYAKSVYYFADEKIEARIFEDLITYRSLSIATAQPIPRPRYSLYRLRLRYESLPFEALPKLCLHTLHLRCRDLSTGPRRCYHRLARVVGRWMSF